MVVIILGFDALVKGFKSKYIENFYRNSIYIIAIVGLLISYIYNSKRNRKIGYTLGIVLGNIYTIQALFNLINIDENKIYMGILLIIGIITIKNNIELKKYLKNINGENIIEDMEEIELEPRLEKRKINKEFKIVFIINSIVLLISILLCVYALSYETKNEGVLKLIEIFGVGFAVVIQIFLFFVASVILLIITTILGIKNYRKNSNKEIRKKIIVMLSSIIIPHLAMFLIYIINVYVLQ